MLSKSHSYGGGLILRSKDLAVSLAELISVAGRPVNDGEASRVYTEFGQISYQFPDDIKLTLSAALHGPSVIPRKRKPSAGGCVDLELEVDEDTRIGAWIEFNKKPNSRILRWAVTLSDTPHGDLGWGVSLRRGTEAKPQLFQVEGFLNLHLGRLLSCSLASCSTWMGGGADLVLYSTRVGPCESSEGTFGRSENAAGIVRWKENNSLRSAWCVALIILTCYNF